MSYTAQELEANPDVSFAGLELNSVRVVGQDIGEVSRLTEIARARGARIDNSPTIISEPNFANEPKIILETMGVINDAVWRAIAKIAFNYLVWIQGPEYVRSERFDRIRTFILEPNQKRALVGLVRQPILADESRRWKGFTGHLVYFETSRRSLVSKVSLFNSITYQVVLCHELGIYYSLSSGHAFDPLRHKMHRLTSIPKHILIPGSAHEQF